MMYIDVILPLALSNAYTYAVSDEFKEEVTVGTRVVVPFGNKKTYTALVYHINTEKPKEVEPKEIMMILDKVPIVNPSQMRLWEWIAMYYQCTIGEIFKAALPSGLKLESETVITVVEDFEADHQLKPKEEEVLDALESNKKPMTIDELNKAVALKNGLPVVKHLMEMGAVEISEELKEKYHAKTETMISLDPQFTNEEKLHALFDELEKAPKQMKLLMTYLNESHFLSATEVKEINKKELLDKCGCAPAILKALTDKRIFVTYQKEVGRNASLKQELHTEPIHPLTSAQQSAYESIVSQFATKQTILLHGVTSSGKTEIYIHLIQEVIKSGKQALFLLPEIALTTQITTRLLRVFGSQMCVYHSKFSDAERVEIWNNMLKGEHCQVILGVRSSIFLPFKNLGLVIVDEEHETSYKQYDPAPRYNARDCAIVLASMCGAKVLLGSATPGIETFCNAQSGKYGYTELSTRYEGIQMPRIIVADTQEAIKHKTMQLNFTPELIKEMGEAFKNKEQVILFQNRRGFSPYIQCKSCGYVPRCKNCDVSLTYHKSTNQLTCHYCGYTYAMPERCPACGNASLIPIGLGTEKIEEEVTELFPEAKVARLDLDVAKSRKNYEKIIADFENGNTDVLVGTQIISKGLDFERVRVVGILNADLMLNYPDFRADERAFQLMAQVSGRAGRHNTRGIVVIQTSLPEHPIIEQVKGNNYAAMYKQQMEERYTFHYPPYFRLIYLYVKGKDYDMTTHAAAEFAANLRAVFASRVYGPDKPVITRIKNMEIRKITLKIERTADFGKAKGLIKNCIDNTLNMGRFKSVFIYSDVDPA